MTDTNTRHEIDAELARISVVRLPPSLCALYEARLGTDRRRLLALALLTGASVLEAATLLNLINDPAMAADQWAPRLIEAMLLVLGAIAVRHVPRGWPELLAFGAPLVAGALLLVRIAATSPAPLAYRLLMVGIVFLGMMLALPPVPVVSAIGLCALAYGAFAAALLFEPGTLNQRAIATLLIFGVLTQCAALAMARRREARRRRDFLIHMRDELATTELSRLNGELARLMHTDVLTGVANRRCFENDLQAAWLHYTERQRLEGIGLLLIDVDHFKAFNDCAGHAEGDSCLRALAGAIASVARGGVLATARWGGEEFVVLARGIARDEMDELGNRVRAAVEALSLPHPAFPGQIVTVSVGAAWCGAAMPCATPEDLLRRADQALYAAKTEGRNRVRMWPAPERSWVVQSLGR